MARPLRIQYPDALYHITSRGNERANIYLSDHDRNQFLNILTDVVVTHNWICHAYCLMGNHYHLVIETPDANLSRGMRDLNSIYSQRFNRIHDRVGHLFQGRFWSFVVEKETYLLEAVRYTVLNPVRAKIVKSPKDWKWSSYLATAGFQKPHRCLTIDRILELFSDNRTAAFKEFRMFVNEGIDGDNPFNQSVEGNILGFPQFVEFIWENNPNVTSIKEMPRKQRMVGRPAIEDILSNCKDRNEREVAIVSAYIYCGYSQKEIADFLGLHYSTVSKILKNSRFKT